MKTNFKNTILLLGIISLGINTNAQELQVTQPLSPAQVIELAQHELPNMLQLIEPEDMQQYGFELTDNFTNIQVGNPFYVTTLPQTSTTENLSTNPYTIMLPLILESRARCVLFVSLEASAWKVVGIGNAPMMKKHQSIFTTLNNGNSFVVVHIPHLSQQYLMTDNMFKPLIQFDSLDMKPISFKEIIALNVSIPVEDNTNYDNSDIKDYEENPTDKK